MSNPENAPTNTVNPGEAAPGPEAVPQSGITDPLFRTFLELQVEAHQREQAAQAQLIEAAQRTRATQAARQRVEDAQTAASEPAEGDAEELKIALDAAFEKFGYTSPRPTTAPIRAPQNRAEHLQRSLDSHTAAGASQIAEPGREYEHLAAHHQGKPGRGTWAQRRQSRQMHRGRRLRALAEDTMSPYSKNNDSAVRRGAPFRQMYADRVAADVDEFRRNNARLSPETGGRTMQEVITQKLAEHRTANGAVETVGTVPVYISPNYVPMYRDANDNYKLKLRTPEEVEAERTRDEQARATNKPIGEVAGFEYIENPSSNPAEAAAQLIVAVPAGSTPNTNHNHAHTEPSEKEKAEDRIARGNFSERKKRSIRRKAAYEDRRIAEAYPDNAPNGIPHDHHAEHGAHLAHDVISRLGNNISSRKGRKLARIAQSRGEFTHTALEKIAHAGGAIKGRRMRKMLRNARKGDRMEHKGNTLLGEGESMGHTYLDSNGNIAGIYHDKDGNEVDSRTVNAKRVQTFITTTDDKGRRLANKLILAQRSVPGRRGKMKYSDSLTLDELANNSDGSTPPNPIIGPASTPRRTPRGTSAPRRIVRGARNAGRYAGNFVNEALKLPITIARERKARKNASTNQNQPPVQPNTAPQPNTPTPPRAPAAPAPRHRPTPVPAVPIFLPKPFDTEPTEPIVTPAVAPVEPVVPPATEAAPSPAPAETAPSAPSPFTPEQIARMRALQRELEDLDNN